MPRRSDEDMTPEDRALAYAQGIRDKDLKAPFRPDPTFFPFLFSPPGR
jgi:hypothetical protein